MPFVLPHQCFARNCGVVVLGPASCSTVIDYIWRHCVLSNYAWHGICRLYTSYLLYTQPNAHVMCELIDRLWDTNGYDFSRRHHATESIILLGTLVGPARLINDPQVSTLF
jgi:hypothetical protein